VPLYARAWSLGPIWSALNDSSGIRQGTHHRRYVSRRNEVFQIVRPVDNQLRGAGPRTIVLYRLFLVGFVLERAIATNMLDVGPATAKLAVAMTEYNPHSK